MTAEQPAAGVTGLTRARRLDPADRARLTLIRSLAILPLAVGLFPSGLALAGATRVVLFSGMQRSNVGTDLRLPDQQLFGWAAQTAQGWIGRMVTSGIAASAEDLESVIFSTPPVVPSGTPNTIDDHLAHEFDPAAPRSLGVCFHDIRAGAVEGSAFKLSGVITHAELPTFFVPGDPSAVAGDRATGEFTLTLRGGGQDRSVTYQAFQILFL